ncbi:MAG: phospholipase A [Gammaproteobacteria bacterium]|nr:phospholipase A [Gammaproteobacteria bacterium]
MRGFSLHIVLGCGLLLLVGVQADADDANQENKVDTISHYLSGNEPSYFVFARDKGDDDYHGEFYLSIKYPLLQRPIRYLLGKNSALNFNYNGLYDFYLASRYSSPIISRRQNPGLMYEYRFLGHNTLRKAKFGYFHESNGQTIDNQADFLNTTNVQDYVSRGWDYLHLELSVTPEESWYVYLQGHLYLNKQMFKLDREEKWPWEVPVGVALPIDEYDGLRLIVGQTLKRKHWYFDEIKLSAIYRTGYHDPGHNSTRRLEATFRIFDVPLYLYYFDGYGINIASYFMKSSSYGIGFELW